MSKHPTRRLLFLQLLILILVPLDHRLRPWTFELELHLPSTPELCSLLKPHGMELGFTLPHWCSPGPNFLRGWGQCTSLCCSTLFLRSFLAIVGIAWLDGFGDNNFYFHVYVLLLLFIYFRWKTSNIAGSPGAGPYVVLRVETSALQSSRRGQLAP